MKIVWEDYNFIIQNFENIRVISLSLSVCVCLVYEIEVDLVDLGKRFEV